MGGNQLNNLTKTEWYGTSAAQIHAFSVFTSATISIGLEEKSSLTSDAANLHLVRSLRDQEKSNHVTAKLCRKRGEHAPGERGRRDGGQDNLENGAAAVGVGAVRTDAAAGAHRRGESGGLASAGGRTSSGEGAMVSAARWTGAAGGVSARAQREQATPGTAGR